MRSGRRKFKLKAINNKKITTIRKRAKGIQSKSKHKCFPRKLL